MQYLIKLKKITAFITIAAIFMSLLPTAYIYAAGTNSDEFDENNIVLRFGVLSDIHMSGTWNIAGNQKLDRAYKALLSIAGKNQDGSTKLDAVFIDGDITDAMNSSGNISSLSTKLEQNYKEIAAFRDITLENFNSADKTDRTALIYANGNHDTAGGIGLNENGVPDTTGFYSAKLYQKIISGYEWQNEIPGNPSATAEQICQYNKSLITEYDEKSGPNYEFFYGKDKYLGADGLDYGNRIVEINGYNFITVEPETYDASYSDETIAWLDETLSAITTQNPSKAVFIASHARVKNTILPSTSAASSDLMPVLTKYPQVIIWGGHEHSLLNRELSIWQGGKGTFTAVDTGVVQYGYAKYFSLYANTLPENGQGFSGYSGAEYRNLSQGQYVEVDASGNVRINRIDFYNSDLENGDIKIIGEPWIISNISPDGSHLDKYTFETRSSENTAPVFAQNSEISAEINDDYSVSVSFPAASDDIRVISYFLSAETKNGHSETHELTSFYYDYADASVLNNRTYSYTFTNLPKNEDISISVYAADDYNAKSEILKTEIIIEGGKEAYPSYEFSLEDINKNGWSSNENAGTIQYNVSFEGRNTMLIDQIESNYNSDYCMIMNNWSNPFPDINITPYIIIDYYYYHDTESSFDPAPQMRWRFFNSSLRQLDKTADLVTNQWASCVISLEDSLSFFSADNYQIKQYKFDPYGTTPLKQIDNTDKLYISGIRLVHSMPEIFTENGKAYVSEDGYIENVGAEIYTSIADAIYFLGNSGGNVYIEGDIILNTAEDLEISETERQDVTVFGYGSTLEEQQKNRIWFMTTDSGRTAKYGGNITFDRITIKAPVDEAGLFSNGVTLTLGKDIITENTVKGSSENIDASGTKDMTFNLGTNSSNLGNSYIDIYGGSYGDAAAFYMWTPGSSSVSVKAEYNFYGGEFQRVIAGVRNSTTGVVSINDDINYNFYGGIFNNVYTGHYKYGEILGDTVFNIYGGNFPNGIYMSNFSAPDSKASAGNTAVIINSKGTDIYQISSSLVIKQDASKPVYKTDSSKKHIAVINNAELSVASFDSSLQADYKIMVYGGSAEPVFSDGILSGFKLNSDSLNLVPTINGNLLLPNENGLYVIPETDNITEIRFAIDFDPNYSESDTPQDMINKLVVIGAQFRVQGNALRFICNIGDNILSAIEGYNQENILCEEGKATGYGFVVIPSAYIYSESQLDKNTPNAAVVPAVKKYDVSNPNYVSYTVCITDIQVKNYAQDYIVRPYITYMDNYGEIVTVYGQSYSTSLLNIAQSAVAADDHAVYAQKIIDDYNQYIESQGQ